MSQDQQHSEQSYGFAESQRTTRASPQHAARVEYETQSLLERHKRQIQATIQMSREIAVVNEERSLYKRAVTVVKEQLGYYHVQLLQHVPAQSRLILAAGYGRTGKNMVEQGYELPIHGSLAGNAVLLGASVLKPDITHNPDHTPHPSLPKAKGEIHVPIKLEQLDAHAQIMTTRQMVEQGFDGLIIIATDEAAITPILRQAKQNNVRIVSTNYLPEDVMTAQLIFDDYDNGYMLGVEAGKWAKAHLHTGESLNLALFNSPYRSTIVQRETGIMEGIKSVYPNVNLVDTAESADPLTVFPIAQRWLEIWPDLHMILGINDSGALGAYAAVVAANKNDGETFFIGGIDATDQALMAIGEGGAYQVTVDQAPREVGYLMLRTLLAAIIEQPYQELRSTKCSVVNRDNLAELLAARRTSPQKIYPGLDKSNLNGLRVGLNVIDLHNPFFVAVAEAAKQEAERLGVELIISDSRHILGVLSVYSDKTNALDSEDQLILEGLCAQIANAVKSLRLFHELRQARLGLERRVQERTAELRQEIAERQRVEQIMLQSAKMASVGRLAAGVAHEINNPLGAMVQSAQVLHMRLNPYHASTATQLKAHGIDLEKFAHYMESRGIYEYLDGIREVGNRAAKIVSDLLSFSHDTTSQMVEHDLNTLVRQALALADTDYDLKKAYDLRNVKVIESLSPNLPSLICDGQQIQQAILNIIRNAIQAMAEKKTDDYHPTLVMRTAQSEAELILEIEDNGPGIPEALKPQVFDPFFTTKDVGEGTGLGLWLCWSIIAERHKGEINIEDALNEGTRCIIKLPLTH